MKNLTIIAILLLYIGILPSKAQEFTYHSTINVDSPQGICVENNKYIYVTSAKSQQVKKIDLTSGNVIFTLGTKNVTGKDKDHFNNPYSICQDKNKDIYIADKNNKRILIYSNTGKYISEINLNTYTPYYINFSPQGSLYVSIDGKTKGIIIIKNRKIDKVITKLSKDKFRNPKKIYFNTKGEIFIADTNTGIIKISCIKKNIAQVDFIIKKDNGINIAMKNESVSNLPDGRIISSSIASKKPMKMGIYIYSKQGKKLATIGRLGSRKKNVGFNAPADIYTSSNNKIYIADSKNNRIQIWKFNDIVSPQINSLKLLSTSINGATISINTNEKAEIFYLAREKKEASPSVNKIINSKNSKLYDDNNKAINIKINNLSINKEYIVYFVARDLSNNISTIKASQIINTKLSIQPIVIKNKKPQEVTIALNASSAGNIHIAIEECNGANKKKYTYNNIKNDDYWLRKSTINYTHTNEFTYIINHLDNKKTYRIFSFLETKQGLKSKIVSSIFTSQTDIDIIRSKYTHIILGNNPDYTNKNINKRYKNILEYTKRAHRKKMSYNYSNPGAKMDLIKKNKDIVLMREICQNVLFPLALSYNIQGPKTNNNPDYKNPNTLNDILKIYKYLIARGFTKTCKLDAKGSGVYLRLTGYFYASFLMQEELKQALLYKSTIQMMDNGTHWQRSNNKNWSFKDTQELKQADRIRTMYNNRVLYILSMPADSLHRRKEMQYMSKIYKEVGNPSQGWAGFIKPDYVGYHHNGAWGNAYFTGAIHEYSKMAYLLSGTKYALSKSNLANISECLLAYRIYSNKYDIPKGISGRFPTNLTAITSHMPAFAYVYLSSNNADYRTKIASAFVRLYDTTNAIVQEKFVSKVECDIMYQSSLGSLQQMEDIISEGIKAEQSPTGNWVYPYAGMQIHRRHSWMVSVKGFSKYIWDFESNGEQNWFGRNQSAGAIEIYATKNKNNFIDAQASGFIEPGYDWNHVSGTTCLYLDKWSYFDKKFKWAKFSPEYYMGGVQQDNNGMFAIKYVDVRSRNSLKAHKSVFMFDDLIIALGSDICNNNKRFDSHTSIFQNHLTDISTPNTINKNIHTGISLNYTALDGKKISFTDAVGNAYFMKDGSNLRITRQKQTSRDNRDKKDTSANWISAWINHAKKKDASYEYCIMVQGKRDIDKLAKNPDDYYEVVQKNKKAHIVNVKSQTAYAIFESGIIDKKIIYSADDACMLMTKKIDTENYKISISQPDFGRYPRNKKPYQVWSIDKDKYNLPSTTQEVNIVLNGEWYFTNSNNLVSKIEYNKTSNKTKILFKCIDAKTISINISKHKKADKKTPNLIIHTPTNKIFSNKAFKLNASSDSKSPILLEVIGNNASITDNMLHVRQVGEIIIKASQNENNIYSYCKTQISFMIYKANQEIIFDNISDIPYSKKSYKLEATASSQLKVDYSIISGNASVTDGIVYFDSPGEIIIKAIQNGNNNYLAAESVEKKIIVLANPPKEAKIVFTEINTKTYGDQAFKINVHSSNPEPILLEVTSNNASIKNNVLSILNAGEIIIKAWQTENKTYSATQEIYTFKVRKAKQSISLYEIENQSLSTEGYILNAKSSSQLKINYKLIKGNAEIINNRILCKDIGEYTIEASQCGNINYLKAESKTISFKVHLPIDVTDNNATEIDIYPIPTKDYIIVNTHNTEAKIIKIYNTNGHMVYRDLINKQSQIDLSKLVKGTYIISIKMGKQKISRKIIVN